MSRRRPPRGAFQRLQDGTKAQRTGGAGLVCNSAPIWANLSAAQQALSSVADVTQTAWQDDSFTLTAGGAQTKTLTYLPVDESEDVKLNGLGQLRTTDWTRSGQTLSVLSAMGALTDDVLTVHYQYLTGQPELITDYDNDYVTAVMADAPLVYYRMGGTGSTEQDVTTHNRDGTLSGNYVRSRTGLLTTEAGDATDFGASNQRVGGISTSGSVITCPYDAGLITADWSFELWTNKGSSAATAVFVWEGRLRIVVGDTMDVRYFTDASNHSRVALSGTGLLTGTDYTGSIKHLVVTANATTDEVKFYKDGVQFGSTVTGVTTALRTDTTDLKMGWCDGSDGMCDTQEFAFYGTALSAAQVAAHWDAA